MDRVTGAINWLKGVWNNRPGGPSDMSGLVSPYVEPNAPTATGSAAYNWLGNLKPLPTSSPTPTPTPTPAQEYVPKITVPSDKGEYTFSPEISQSLLNSFDDIKQATNAARVIMHPMADTNIPGERERGVNLRPNRGENPDLITGLNKIQNPNGTYDAGFTRINSGTFAEMQNNSYWRHRMAKLGINRYEDMADTNKAIAMARLVLEYGNWDIISQGINSNPNWRLWYAAPRDLRLGQ